MLRRCARWALTTIALSLALLTATSAYGTTARVEQTKAAITQDRQATWTCQDSLQRTRTRASHSKLTGGNPYLQWVHRKWHKRSRTCIGTLRNPPHFQDWLCIHRGEGGWTTNTSNGYYGGLQMDYSFMRSYGWKLLNRKGTADHWTWFEQIWVAERARASGRGFYPWPNTARACGLI